MGTGGNDVTYAEKLQDPRWQRLRLKIFERDKWKCVVCGDGTTALNIHHGFYRYGKEPWELPEDTMWSVCEGCHQVWCCGAGDLRLIVGRIHPSDYGCAMSALEDINKERQHNVRIR
jgi:hypothetical protein